MTRVHTAVVIMTLAAGVVFWQLWPEPAVPDPVVERTSPPPDPASPALPPQQQAAEPAEIAETKRAPVIDTETKFGLAVRKDRNCTLTVRRIPDAETAELREVYDCTPNDPEEPDPYESWQDEVLAGMAYGDAHAAEVLGLRHVIADDPKREAFGLSLLYRSVALSGDPETFRKAIGRRYAYLSINGEPQLHNLNQMLVFSIIGQTLGDPRFKPAQVEQALRAASVAEEHIDTVRQHAQQILLGMADLQSEITGNRTIAEALENA